jgi:hypothetical protein
MVHGQERSEFQHLNRKARDGSHCRYANIVRAPFSLHPNIPDNFISTVALGNQHSLKSATLNQKEYIPMVVHSTHY